MNKNNINNKSLNHRRKIMNDLIQALSFNFNKLNTKVLYKYRSNICRLIMKFIHINTEIKNTIDYYDLASKICNKILDNKIYSMDSIESLSDFISSRIPDLNIEFVNYFSKSSKCCIKRFKKKLMANVRLWITQRRIDQIKDHTNTVNKQNKKHVDELKKQFVDINQRISRVNSKIYTNVATILGLFIAIMVAVFGSLQLYGSVFHNVNGLTHKGLGKAVILGSLVIFGTYMILSLLLKGLSKLMKFKHFHISLSFTIYFISSLIILSLIGTMIAYPEVCKEIEQHIKCISKIVYVIVAIIFVDMSVFVFKYYNVKKHIKNESKNMSNK